MAVHVGVNQIVTDVVLCIVTWQPERGAVKGAGQTVGVICDTPSGTPFTPV